MRLKVTIGDYSQEVRCNQRRPAPNFGGSLNFLDTGLSITGDTLAICFFSIDDRSLLLTSFRMWSGLRFLHNRRLMGPKLVEDFSCSHVGLYEVETTQVQRKWSESRKPRDDLINLERYTRVDIYLGQPLRLRRTHRKLLTALQACRQWVAWMEACATRRSDRVCRIWRHCDRRVVRRRKW